MVLDLVTNPNRFFARRAEQPRWGGPVLVVLLTGFIGIASQFPVFNAISGSLPPEVANLALVFQLIGAGFGLVATLVFWLVTGVILHIVATVAFDGAGDLWGLVKLSGWGYAPQIVGALVTAVVTFTVYSSVQFPTDPQALAQFTLDLQRRPEFLVATVVNGVVMIWSGLLWGFAVEHSRGVTFRQGVLTASVVVVLNLLLQLSGFLFGGSL